MIFGKLFTSQETSLFLYISAASHTLQWTDLTDRKISPVKKAVISSQNIMKNRKKFLEK